MSEPPQETEQQQPLIWRRRIVAIVLVLLAVSITGRVMLKNREPTGSEGGGLRTGLVAGETETETDETLGGRLGRLLPYITDAGIALLLGMIAGIGTRMAIKAIVFVLVLGVIGIQFGIHKGWLDPNDLQFFGNLKDYVFNIPEGKEGKAMAIDKAPSIGALLLGFMMGLKRG